MCHPTGQLAFPGCTPTERMAVNVVTLEGEMKSAFAETSKMYFKDDPMRIESWYGWIKEYTFPTHWFSLSLEEVQALVKFRDAVRLTKAMAMQNNNKSGPIKDEDRPDDLEWSQVQYLEAEHLNILLNLAAKIDKCIDELYCNGHEDDGKHSEKPAFVRLSTRSPKDSALTSKKIKDELRYHLQEVMSRDDWKDLTLEEKENLDLECFTKCQSFALKIENGTEALNLLGNSQRVFKDLQMCMLTQGTENLDIQMIVRKWQAINPTWEFRAFVGPSGELTGCAQYYKKCFVPEIARHKDELEKLILLFFSKVKDKIPLHKYTIDFVVDPKRFMSSSEEDRQESIQIVELNHFPPVAGTSLFEWESEHDRKIIAFGPFEFRVHLKPLEQPYKEIPEHLQKFIKTVEGLEYINSKSKAATAVACTIPDNNQGSAFCKIQ
eukprot:TRINITY_DN12888_c0_g1_i1.p1 TRINITY_DN12888_c0_g1~~TRINITY_DN12888_c0_g1_i1.p1  ORF type:complete len:436 (-),score=127.95 TRINITY_DN12888_c0_g1_i1:1064-2371(-)